MADTLFTVTLNDGTVLYDQTPQQVDALIAEGIVEFIVAEKLPSPTNKHVGDKVNKASKKIQNTLYEDPESLTPSDLIPDDWLKKIKIKLSLLKNN